MTARERIESNASNVESAQRVPSPERSLWITFTVAQFGEAQPSENPSRDGKGAGNGDAC
jgi:hypothetical protein